MKIDIIVLKLTAIVKINPHHAAINLNYYNFLVVLIFLASSNTLRY